VGLVTGDDITRSLFLFTGSQVRRLRRFSCSLDQVPQSFYFLLDRHELRPRVLHRIVDLFQVDVLEVRVLQQPLPGARQSNQIKFIYLFIYSQNNQNEECYIYN